MASSSTTTTPFVLPVGTRVRLDNLQSAQEINGAIGLVAGEPRAESGRIPIKLLPPACDRWAQGILARPANITELPLQRVVLLKGFDATEVDLTHQQSRLLISRDKAWLRCDVPHLLGVLLLLMQLAPTTCDNRLSNEQPGVFMLINRVTSFAPAWVQMDGLGEVLLARADGESVAVAAAQHQPPHAIPCCFFSDT